MNHVHTMLNMSPVPAAEFDKVSLLRGSARLALLCTLIILPSQYLSSQSLYLPLDHSLNRRIGAAQYLPGAQTHPSIQPWRIQGSGPQLDSLLRASAGGVTASDSGSSWLTRKVFDEHLFQVDDGDVNLWFDFLPDMGLGKDVKDGRTTWLNTRGFEFAGSLGSSFFFRTQYYESVGKFPTYIDSYIRTNEIVPGQGAKRRYGAEDYDYGYASGSISWTPSPYFNLQFGHDKNFIGDGYRSLFLSDVSFNYPFLKLTAHVWHFDYMIMWAELQDLHTANGSETVPRDKKYVALHYLDWNVTDWLSLGFFEAVVWKNADSAGYRGFEYQYLNPLIFFRPVEFSIGSPDNMLLGLNVSVRLPQSVVLYGQALIDEMTIGEYFKGSGYWGNKYGLLAGVKAFDAFGVDRLYLQTEGSLVSPYTYSHREALTNYGHYGQPLSHPLGANFYEWLGIAQYEWGRIGISARLQYALIGKDPTGENFGSDIFKSYDTRIRDYGNHIGQGDETDLRTVDVRTWYVINPTIGLRFEVAAYVRSASSPGGTQNSVWLQVGLRSGFRNLYCDL